MMQKNNKSERKTFNIFSFNNMKYFYRKVVVLFASILSKIYWVISKK